MATQRSGELVEMEITMVNSRRGSRVDNKPAAAQCDNVFATA
jgi:hypothetical protein